MKFEFVKRIEEKGLQWKFRTDNGVLELSIICHHYSYGGEEGLFETMSSWEEDVSGRLTFGEVQKRIEMIYKLENNMKQSSSKEEKGVGE